MTRQYFLKAFTKHLKIALKYKMFEKDGIIERIEARECPFRCIDCRKLEKCKDKNCYCLLFRKIFLVELYYFLTDFGDTLSPFKVWYNASWYYYHNRNTDKDLSNQMIKIVREIKDG